MLAARVVIALALGLPAGAQPRDDPRAISIHPFVGQRGSTLSATLRGAGLAGAHAASVGGAPFTVTVEGVEPEPAGDSPGRKAKIDLVKLRIEVRPDAKPGRYPIRLIARNGVSNALPIEIVEAPVSAEPAGAHETRESAVPIATLPAIYSGRLSRRGETDYYTFRADAGQVVTIQAISGLPQIAAAGSAATVPNFDPALTVYEPAGSWFDPHRLNRIAYNDEPVWVFGKPTDALLVHRFARAGEYLLRVEAFAGQGGPDYSYILKVSPGAPPEQKTAAEKAGWDERGWPRKLEGGRLNQLAKRGGSATEQPTVETYRGAPEPVAFRIPGTIEGALAEPGAIHRARFHLDKPADIAIEIETPAAAPPFFNPLFRLLNPAGEEVASSIQAGKGACSGALTKSMQSKTILPLRDTGDYTLEIRDATADLAGPDFRYRVQVRPQVPHIGQIRIDVDTLNLSQGQAKTVPVVFDREEDYRGALVVAAESLPPGVLAVAGADYEPDKDPPSTVGKRERYLPRTERLVVALTAAADAPVSAEPQTVRLVARPLVNGKLGDILFTKTFPMMVLPKP
jgi:hypothetical protein